MTHSPCSLGSHNSAVRKCQKGLLNILIFELNFGDWVNKTDELCYIEAQLEQISLIDETMQGTLFMNLHLFIGHLSILPNSPVQWQSRRKIWGWEQFAVFLNHSNTSNYTSGKDGIW